MRRLSPSPVAILVALVAITALIGLRSPDSLLAAQDRAPKNPGATATPVGPEDTASPSGKPARPPRFTATPTWTATATATILPSVTATETATPLPSATATPSATLAPSPSPTAIPTKTPLPTATYTSTPTLAPTPSPVPAPYDLLWQYRAGMPTGRAYLGAATSGGHVYAIGGMVWDGSIVSTVEAYDPMTDSWHPRKSMSSPRTFHAVATTPDGKIYAIGGTDSLTAEGLTASVEVYDPSLDIWTPVAPMPLPRCDMSAAAGLNGKIYVFGGTTPGDLLPEAVFEYDPTANSWARKANMPVPRVRTAAVLASDGRIYVIGGNPQYMPPGYYSSPWVEAYDPETDSWQEMAGMPYGRDSLGAVSTGGKIYAIGGNTDDGSYGDNPAVVYRYEVAGNSWGEDSPLQSPRAGLGAVQGPNGKIYAVGGTGYDSLDTLEEATIYPNGAPTPTATAVPPHPTSTTVPPPSPTPTSTATATPVPLPSPTATLVPGQEQMSVAYQVNPAHSGNQAAAGGSLVKKWTVNFGRPVSYPLIAGGKVFVAVKNDAGYGTQLYALDAATGEVAWGPLALGGTYYRSGIAYDDGRLFALNYDGLLRALDPETGTELWQSQMAGQYAFTSPPTALQGVVYVGGAGSGGTLYALNSVSGALLWKQSVANGDQSAPAISEDGVFVSYACLRSYKFDRWNGDPLWDYYSGCSGGGGRTAVYHDGRLYVRDAVSYNPDYILDAQSGAVAGTFQAGPAPAFAGGLGYFVSGGQLTATDLADSTTEWTFPGDMSLSSAPVVMGSIVYVGSTSGKLYGLDAATGQLVWQDLLAAAIPAPDEHNVSAPLTGFGAGEGLLVVPAGNLLAAFGS